MASLAVWTTTIIRGEKLRIKNRKPKWRHAACVVQLVALIEVTSQGSIRCPFQHWHVAYWHVADSF